MNEVKYEVVNKHEVPELSTIKKSNISTEITLADTLRAIEQNEKIIGQVESELGLKKALIVNVETNYPEVKDIDLKTQIACHTYYEANRYVALAEAKLKEFKEAQGELNAEVVAIKEQTGLEKMSVEQKNEIIEAIKEKVESGEVTLNTQE